MKINFTAPKALKRFNAHRLATVLILSLMFQLSRAQETCATAIPITAGLYTVGVITGTNIPNTCSNATNAEWYVYTPTDNHSVTITSDLPQNVCHDTNFSVYTGTCSGLVCYAQDDDSGIIPCTSGNTSYLSVKTFDALAGTTYYIAWDNSWQATGFDFQLTEAQFFPSPCSVATPVFAGITTVNAIDGGNVTTSCSTASLGKWYVYAAASNLHVTVSSDLPQNICKDTNFSVYTGSCSGGLTCVASDDNSGIIPCDSGNTESNLSKKSFDVAAGVTYFIAWDNKWSADGFDFQITEAPIIIPVSFNNLSIPTINSAYNLCIVDMDGDGLDDVAGVSDGNLHINYQGAGGVLTPVNVPVTGPSNMPGWSLAAGDYNRDGHPDILIGASDGISLWTSNTTGTAYTAYTPGEFIFCQRTNMVDINNDGNLDLFSCHDIAPNVYYLYNGAGGFTYYQSGTTPGAYSLGVYPDGGNYATLWTDYDNDGDLDMFVSKCSGPPCELHRNDGNGVFTDVSAIAGINFQPVTSWSSAIADFDNDGDMDWIIGSNGGAQSRYFRNNLDTSNSSEEAWTDISAGSGWDTNPDTNRDYVAFDFDNDGWVDVLGGGNKIMFNKGDGTFEPTHYTQLGVGAIGDLNHDGFLDIENGSTIHYAVPNGNNWFGVTLHGIQSNSNGIGARLEIHGAFGIKIRDIRSGEGFGYMNSLNANFGLGSADAIESLVIKWPSGVVDTILNPGINQYMSVVEGSTLSTNSFESHGFAVYPNPAADVLSINSGKDVMASAEIFDIAGRKVLNSSITNQTISVSKLKTGSYILLLKDATGKDFTVKFIKK